MYLVEREMAMNRIAIVGGGPGGLMLARLLQLRGAAPVVFERDAHADERPQGGSLDLHVETGLRAMRLAGLWAEFAAAARPEDQGDRLYDPDGRLLFDHDGKGDDRPEIDRTALRRILLDALAPGTVRWGSRIAVEAAGDGWEVSGGGRRERFDFVVGADGAWSRVRPLLSDAVPGYDGVTFVELGFVADRHPRIAELTGSGKMFAVGDNRALIAQRNGLGHIRGYAGLRASEATPRAWSLLPAEAVRAALRDAFAGWAPRLTEMVEAGEILAVRGLYSLPTGHRWASRPGLTLIGDAAHLMSPFSGEGVNLALADAVDLAEALGTGGGTATIAAFEARMAARAAVEAADAAQALNGAFSSDGLAAMLGHYRERVSG